MSAPTPPPNPQPSTTNPVSSSRRKWLFRLAAITLIPAAVFSLLELGLRAGGYGHTTRFFIDGSDLEQPGYVIDNRDFGRWVFPRGMEQTPFPVPFAIRTEKSPRVYRVFVLGESAAMGFPDPSSSFARVLEVMLRARYPDTIFEVVNVSMVAINSHIVLPIARECAEQKPDLFVVHLGNNEVVGPFGAAGVLGSYMPSRRVVKMNLGVRRTRMGQLLDSFASSLRGGGERKNWKGMEMFLGSQVREDDSRLPKVHEQFRQNLGEICDVGEKAKIPVVVCTIPVNLKDCAPFSSLHKSDLADDRLAAWDAAFQAGVRAEDAGKFDDALARFAEAAAIDDRHAELAFRRARCSLALNRTAEAKELFSQARNLDTLRFRTDPAINRVIRDVVSDRGGRNIHLADAEHSFAEASPHGIPGESLFLEHVHMNFTGNHLMAKTVLHSAAPILDGRLIPGPQKEAITEQECATRLAYTDWNKMRVFSEIRSRVLTTPPFTNQCDRAARDARWDAICSDLQKRLTNDEKQRMVDQYLQAVSAADRDWMMRMNFGQLLNECNLMDAAEEQYRAAADILRHCFPARTKLGQIALRNGRTDEAERHFQAVIRIAPDAPDGHIGIAETLGARGRVDEGLAIYEKWLDKMPTRTAGLLSLAGYLERAGRIEDSKRRLLEAVEADPHDTAAFVQLGDLAMKQGKRDEALAMYDAALRRRPDWPDMKAHVEKVKSGAAK